MRPVELPTFEATWWPLFLEAVPGSGERVTVAVLVRAASGQSRVRQVLSPAVLAQMFGATTGKGLAGMVSATVVDMQQQLDEGAAIDQLQPAFGGFHFGHARDGVARDMQEVFDVALRLSSAFEVSPFGARLEPAESSVAAFEDWAQRVRAELLATEGLQSLGDVNFGVRVRLARKQVRYGLLHGGYVANFGVLRPGHLAGDVRSLKVKIFDLEALRRDQQLHPIANADAVVACPARQALQSYSRRELDSYHSSLDFLEAEARARRVDFVRCADPAQAAIHIRQRLAA